MAGLKGTVPFLEYHLHYCLYIAQILHKYVKREVKHIVLLYFFRL